MHTVNIRELKNNPSQALRGARDDLVIVMNRDEPQAVLMDLRQIGTPSPASIRVALAVTLFKQGNVSLGYAARVAAKTLPEMMAMLAAMQIPLVTVTASDITEDLAIGKAWFAVHKA